MPRIELIPLREYQPNDPYFWSVDNQPIEDLALRIDLVNSATDNNYNILTDSIGTQGTLANRLNRSINQDGTLKTIAVDNALHNIAEHSDGSILISNIPVNYVRMLKSERDKLTLISNSATNLAVKVNVQTPSVATPITFNSGTMEIAASDSISWEYLGGKIQAVTNIPIDVQHIHHYDVAPAFSASPDFIHYKTTSLNTSYLEGSLRVYVNGSRLSEATGIYVPGNAPTTNPVTSWKLLSYTEGTAVSGTVTTGTFTLSAAITSLDVIRIDFDQPLV